MERIQKIIAQSGVCSRRKAEELIARGRVKVNGETAVLGTKAKSSDVIEIDGRKLENKEEKVIFLLNKPKNVLSAVSDGSDRLTVADLVESEYRLYPVGRLDYDSSGLLLMTNDGELTQKIIHPKFEVEKTYEVTISSLISEKEIERLKAGVVIDGRKTSPCEIELVRKNDNKKTSFLLVTIHEGRNREIRKMFKTIGKEVIRLHRIKEANIELGDLKPGEYRRLKNHEIVKLKRYLDGGNI